MIICYSLKKSYLKEKKDIYNIRLRFIFALFALVVRGKFKTGRIPSVSNNCVLANSRRGKTNCICRRAKITRGINKPVYSILLVFFLSLSLLKCTKWTDIDTFLNVQRWSGGQCSGVLHCSTSLLWLSWGRRGVTRHFNG